MEDIVIEIKDMSKSFIISHEKTDDDATTLREAFSGIGKKIFSKAKKREITPAKETFWALQDVSFQVKRGSRVGIIGRNGAGKSTLLKILSKITEPTSGSLKIEGKVVSLLEVGTGFHPELSGRENIFLNGVILGMKRAEIRKKFDEIVAFAEIEAFLDTPVKKYSSGMYMRLAFAIAAHIEPDILILDEMLAVGDAQFQKKCLAKMDEISKTEGRTVLFVSHNIESVIGFCNQGIYLQKGRLISQGPIEEVVKDYMVDIHEGMGEFKPNTHHDIYFNTLSFEPSTVAFGETLVLKLELISKACHEQYLIGLNFSDIADNKVAGSLLFSSQPLQQGSNFIELHIPTHKMVPDDYSLNIAVTLSREFNNIDVVMGYPEFTIESNGSAAMETEEVFKLWSRTWGNHILDNIEWKQVQP